MSLLAQIAIFLAAAVIAIPIFRRFKLGSVLGYLDRRHHHRAGCLGLISRSRPPQHIAEFGIVLLMFVIGLELQPSRLWVLRKPIFGLGWRRWWLTTARIGAAAYFAFGSQPGNPPWSSASACPCPRRPWRCSCWPSAASSIPSSGAPHSASCCSRTSRSCPRWPCCRCSVWPRQNPRPAGGWLVLKLIAVLAAVIIGGRYVLRPMLRIVAATRVAEAFTAAGLLIVMGTALLVSQVGLSLSLGAFLAGVLLADSEFRHELEADIEPFKGLLLGLFFISVGMSANLAWCATNPLLIIGLTLAFMLLKVGVLWVIGRCRGTRPMPAAAWPFSLPSGGEFAFVCSVWRRVSASWIADAELLVLVVTASMILSPCCSRCYDVTFKPPESDSGRSTRRSELYPKVIIAGFGRFGQIVGRILRAKQIPFTALEASQTQVDFLRRFGNQVFYGDASRLELLRAAHAENAEVFVLAIDDVEASVRTAELIRKHFPHLKIFARARNRQHAFRLMDLDVRYVIRETLVSSLEMSVQVLEALGLSKIKGVGNGASLSHARRSDHGETAAVKDDEKQVLQTTANPPSSCCTCSKPTATTHETEAGHSETRRRCAVPGILDVLMRDSAAPWYRSSRSW
jgi:Kef-type K+ transport system membrane component KefB